MDQTNSKDFPSKINLRIDWGDIDIFGHVNNVVFFRFVQAGRVNYWEQVGINGFPEESGIGPLLLSSECRFHKPLYYPGTVDVITRVEFIKNSSFCFNHIILNEKGEKAAEAKDVMVYFDYHKKEKVSVPEIIRDNIRNFEGKEF